MRFILGIVLIYGLPVGCHVGLSDTKKTIIFIGRAPSGCVQLENACNNCNAILRNNYWLVVQNVFQL